jgi:hypothetical protein
MGLFDLFKRKGPKPEAPSTEPSDWEPEAEVVAVAVVREGMSLPSDDEMRALIAATCPEHVDLPRAALAQPHWWKQEDWVPGGLRGVARALVRQHDNDPDKATWELVKDARGARVGLVLLRR